VREKYITLVLKVSALFRPLESSSPPAPTRSLVV